MMMLAYVCDPLWNGMDVAGWVLWKIFRHLVGNGIRIIYTFLVGFIHFKDILG